SVLLRQLQTTFRAVRLRADECVSVDLFGRGHRNSKHFLRSCYAASFRSTVTNTSNSFSASSSNSPFLIPLQPCFGTVVTAWPTRSRANRRSTHSSSKIFTSPPRRACTPSLLQEMQ